MDESTTTTTSAATSMTTNLTTQQQQLFQQQAMLLHQYQQQQSQQQQNANINLLALHQQQQKAMSRFPSNIDAHLRPPGMRSSSFNHVMVPPNHTQTPPQNAAAVQHQMHLQQQKQEAAAAAAAAVARQGGNPIEVEMAQQDALNVCKPDLKRPFSSIEDAVNRLLPYHVASDYEAEEDDRMLNIDTTGQVPSRLQQWDHNILAKIAEFTTTFEKQVLAFNILSKKRAQGEFRSEERLMIEHALLQEEKQATLEIQAEMESKGRATREAAETKMRMAMAQAEQARAQAQAQAQAQMMNRLPNAMRSRAIVSHGDGGSQVQDMMHGWGSNSNNNSKINIGNSVNDTEEEPTEDFFNDENDPEDDDEEEAESEDDGELDLNTR